MISAKGHSFDLNISELVAGNADLPGLESFVAPRPSRAERMAVGRALRKKVQRSAHAEYKPSPRRADPIEMLEAQNATRVQKLVPVRMARMVESPFAFLRGSAAVMAADLATTPITGLNVFACGDMHLANFGMFASAERNLVFAINDFDEVHPGPWEWDLKRLAASAALAASFVGGRPSDSEKAARAVVLSYAAHIRRYAEMGHLQVWYDQIDEATILKSAPARIRANASAAMAKARAKGHMRALDRLTEQVDGEHRIIEDLPLIARETHNETGMPIMECLDALLKAYLNSLPDDRKRLVSRYRIIDVVRKVVGVGSVGTNCWVILLAGFDGDDPLFLQVKEAQASVLAPYVELKLSPRNHGRRVVTGQRMIQGSPDIFLGWGNLDQPGGRHYYVRQLADMKGGFRFNEGARETLEGLPAYCRLCGWALALAHAKSGEPAIISGYCGNGEALAEAICAFASSYQLQTQRDHEALDEAIRAGRFGPLAH